MTGVEMNTDLLSQIVAPLLAWFSANKRDLPWRQDREPYHVWLSEIMLQQTRVEAVKGYYARFLAAAPDVFALAALPEAQLMKLWEGLGYYNRARNLHRCAKELAARGGAFPKTRAELLKLPGIGDYTAGAIASICFDEPVAAVDGNVLRVCARVLEDDRPVDAPQFRKELSEALSAVYPKGRCGDFTQALMELGATVCVPNGAPNCEGCPIRQVCRAKAHNAMLKLPARLPRRGRRQEAHTLFLLRCGNLTAVEQRPNTGLLAGLWQLPNTGGLLSEAEAGAYLSGLGLGELRLRSARDGGHIFTHIEWKLRCYEIECEHAPAQFVWASPEELAERYSLPTAFRQFLLL